MLARSAVETWERLLENGDPTTLKKLAVAKRLARLAERAPHWWLPGTEITMAFDNLPEPKLWCWWIRQLQLGQGLFGAHLPNMDRTKTTVTANQQRKYWEKGLGMSSLAGTYGGDKPEVKKVLAVRLSSALIWASCRLKPALSRVRMPCTECGLSWACLVTTSNDMIASDDAPIV